VGRARAKEKAAKRKNTGEQTNFFERVEEERRRNPGLCPREHNRIGERVRAEGVKRIQDSGGEWKSSGSRRGSWP